MFLGFSVVDDLRSGGSRNCVRSGRLSDFAFQFDMILFEARFA